MRRVAALGLFLLFATHGTAAAQNAPEKGVPGYTWNHRLPLWGKRLAARGIRFPLPFGVGLNYVWMDQPIRIDNLQLALNDSEFVSLDDVVAFDSVDAVVHGLNARLDVWLFPFMNVYGLLNYAIESQTDVRLSEPFPLDAGATQSGGGGGLGTTVAMGAWGFFATLDFNWTRNKMQKLDIPVDTLLFAPRVGRQVFRSGNIVLTAWLGAMYQHIGVETRGKIRLSEALGNASDSARERIESWYDGLPPGRQAVARSFVNALGEAVGEDPVVRYRLDKQAKYSWNMLVGAQLELSEQWQLRAEAGFINRTQVILGINYRFGLLASTDTP